MCKWRMTGHGRTILLECVDVAMIKNVGVARIKRVGVA